MGVKDENIFGFVENISEFLNVILFKELGITVKDYDEDEELLDLKNELKNYIEKKEFKKAEDLLFKEIENEDKNHSVLRVAYWFYFKLNSYSEEELKKEGFERLDILNGLRKIENFCLGGIN